MQKHTSFQAEIHESVPADESQPVPSWRESELFKTLEAVRPYLSWLIMGLMAMVTLYISFHDANAEQGTTLHDLEKRVTKTEATIVEKSAARDRQFDKVYGDMVTKDMFNERTGNLDKKIDEIRDDQKEVINLLRGVRPLAP